MSYDSDNDPRWPNDINDALPIFPTSPEPLLLDPLYGGEEV
jgi:hypothetical protein